MKKQFLLSFLLLALNIQAQKWSEVGGANQSTFNNYFWKICSDDSGNVYTSGVYTNSAGYNYVAKWDGTKWSELGTGGNALNANANINTVAADHSGNVYAAGQFTDSNGQYIVAKWDGNSWTQFGTFNNNIWCVYADDSGNVYAAGNFINNSGKRYISKWDGKSWDEMSGSNSLDANGFIYTIEKDDSGYIYAGGGFTNTNGNYYVAKWDGNTWSEIGTGANALNANGSIYCIAKDKSGNIYTGGFFTNANSYWYVAKWNGTKWSELGTGANALYALGEILAMELDSFGNLFIGGWFIKNNSYYYIANWNGTKWQEVGIGAAGLNANALVAGLSIDPSGNIYAAGRFTNKNGNCYVAQYDCITPNAPANSTSASLLTMCSGSKTKIHATGMGKISWYTDSIGGKFLDTGDYYKTPVLTQTTTYYAQDSVCYTSNTRTAITVTVHPLPIVNITQHNVTCFGDSNADIQINATGTGSLKYIWSPNVSPTSTANNLKAGSYICTVRDSFSCGTNKTITITQAPAIIPNIISQTNNICSGDSKGSVSVGASGGCGSFTYKWLPSGDTTATVSNLKASTIICIISDSCICAMRDTIIITEPNKININIVSQNNIMCNGDSSGSASVSASGGSGNLSYSWSPNGGNTSTASNLKAGIYICTVTDSNKCSQTQTIIIAEPARISVGIASVNGVSCNGGNNGSVSVSASGGTGNLSYSWSPSGGNTSTASGLIAGNYVCTITDSNSCTRAINVTVTEPAAIDKGVTMIGATMSSNQSNASYQWMNCDLKTIIIGATNQSYTPNTAGKYAVIIKQNTCTDTSGCYYMMGTGISENNISYNFEIFPNPSNGQITIHSTQKLSSASIKLYNITGQTIMQKTNLSGDGFMLDISGHNNGMYILEINENGNVARLKVVKE